MSFRCEICKQPQPDHTKPVRVVTEEREKIYPPRYRSDRTLIDEGGVGTEIVKEKSLCQPCARRLQ
jgi:hypothetical protein